MKCNLSLLKYPYFHSSHIRVHKTLLYGVWIAMGDKTDSLRSLYDNEFRFNIVRLCTTFSFLTLLSRNEDFLASKERLQKIDSLLAANFAQA